jgi:hypothetical protein
MTKPILIILIAMMGCVESNMCAQNSAIAGAATVLKESATFPPGTNTPAMLVMIENRSRVLGSKMSADGTLYLAVTMKDVAGATPSEIIQRLSPTVNAPKDLRNVQMVVDLPTPVILFDAGNQPVNIGTPRIQGAITNVNVQTNIMASGITVIRK